MNDTGKYIEVVRPGMLTTVQDSGRTGYQQYGMPVSGPMDEWSFRLANILAGNPAGAACLEVTVSGPEILFQTAATFAVCGADMDQRINGKAISLNKAYTIIPGDTLTMGYARTGCRAYIAFSGGVEVPLVMGSRSTYLSGRIGGFHGRPLMKGDRIMLGKSIKPPFPGKLPLATTHIPFASGPVRILPGPETDSLDLKALKTLLNNTFTISNNSNRMGYRLEGCQVKPLPGKQDIISAPVPMGTIQAPAVGTPVILMADRQTTGGYPRVGLVATVDLPRLGQLKPGDTLRFEEISLEDSQKLLTEREKLMEGVV